MNGLYFIRKAIQCGKIFSQGLIPLLQKGLLLLSILPVLPEAKLKAQATFSEKNEIRAFSYEEIPVRVIVDGYRVFYIDAIFGNNKLLFVNVEDLFNTLNIKCIKSLKGNSIDGFIKNENLTYHVDFATRQIKIDSKIIMVQDRILNESGTLYLETSLFSEAFGIDLTFNYRILTIILKADFELPIIKQKRIEELRTNISRIKGEIIADTIVKRDYHILKLGMADWSAGSFYLSNGLSDHHLSFGFGAELLYGEADIAVNYYSRYKFNNNLISYIWRWVDNDKSYIKQAQIGKINNQTISCINAPIIGAVIRNTPTTIRKAKGYYSINELTEPNWSVELYINNVMVDYTKADASGLYTFKVPIVYGYTTLKFKSYGPLGEERTVERTMNVPYTVMPAKEFEYGLSGGVLQDRHTSRFGRADFNYGVSRFLTIGGGLEYLSSIFNSPFIPFVTGTFQPYSKLTLNGEFDYGVKTRGVLNYYLRKDILLEVDYAKYVEGQRATFYNASEEQKVKLSVPLRYKKINGFIRLDYTQLIYKAFNYNQGSLLVSAYYQLFSANSTTQLNWIGHLQAYVISDLALSYRMKKGITIRPSVQVSLSDCKLITSKLAFEKYISRGNISISYERNALYNENTINVNCKYDLPYTRTSLSSTYSRGNLMTSESVQGSVAFGGGNGYVHTSNNSSVGKGGILLCPFLDLNHNGVFDIDEKMVKIKSVNVIGGKVILGIKDSIVRILDLNAFTNYLVEFEDKDLENIAWQFKKKVYQVVIDPNQFKRIDVPVISVGEISGMVNLIENNSLKGIKRINVNFIERKSNKVVAQTLSESDGLIYYLGFEPGEYIARLDPIQLKNLNLAANPPQVDFKIKTSEQGDIVGGIDFVLQPVQNKTSGKLERVQDSLIVVPENNPTRLLSKSDQAVLKGQIVTILNLGKSAQSSSVTNAKKLVINVTDKKSFVQGKTRYKVQLLALRTPIKSYNFFKMIHIGVPDLKIVEEHRVNGYYRYSTESVSTYKEAIDLIHKIRKTGWKDCSIKSE